MASEAMVRHIIGQQGAEALIKITLGAWEDYIAEDRPRYHRTTRAAVVWDYMALRCEEKLPEMEGVRRTERYQRPIYVLRDLIMLRPKMHDRQWLTHNYPTRAQRNVERTGLFEEHEFPNLSFGYRLDAAEAGIEQCVITSPADSWIIDLDDLASGNLTATNPMFDLPEYDLLWQKVPAIRYKDSS